MYLENSLVKHLRSIYTKKTVFNLEAIVFSISSIQKVVQFSKSNPTNYLEESRDVAKQAFIIYLTHTASAAPDDSPTTIGDRTGKV